MQPATEKTVKGNFGEEKLTLRGATYLLKHYDGNYFITESDLSGKPQEHHVDYTLGDRRIQQYLTTLPDGRIIVLPPSWDKLRKEWVHDIDIDNPEEDSRTQIQIWNKTCYYCHVSQEKKNFDLEHNSYHTTWKYYGVSCESCHGNANEHIARANSSNLRNAKVRAAFAQTIINPSRLDPARSTMVCAQCHSLRDMYADGFEPGDSYYDYFVPVMEYRLPTSKDPAYWADGRPRWLANEAFGLWQSACFLKGGATCATCHSDSHNVNVNQDGDLRPENNGLCTKCHKAIGGNVQAHTHHSLNSSGSFCIECHMPTSVIGLDGWIRDHSMSIPVPENSIQHGIPNACNVCHKDKDAQWALKRVNEWYGSNSKLREVFVRRADAFSLARDSNPAAIPKLLEIMSDPSGGPIIRANAAGYLGSFSDDPSAYRALLDSFSDYDPVVRATAASAIRPSPTQREVVATSLLSLLRDPVATVRVSAAVELISMGVQKVPSEYVEQFTDAKKVYQTRAELDSDDARQQFAAGSFFFLSGDLQKAVASFRASLKLDPSMPAQFDLALAMARGGDSEGARKILNAISPDNPQYASAKRLLANLDLNSVSHGGNSSESVVVQNADNAQRAFLDGQVLYQNENFGGALKELEQALHLSPHADWATKALIYRAVCLEKLARTQDAEAAMEALSGNKEARNDMDLQLAHVELLYETGRTNEALKRIDSLILVEPKAPTAYFWRARVLLQLHLINDAATAAEKSIHYAPDFSPAHNLLLRIYQMQGRTKEAEEQAQWLRAYEKRSQ